MAGKFYDCCFGDYKGRLRWIVSHPKHQNDLIVSAPDDIAAIKAAGDYWGENWLSYEFYPYCTVRKA